MHGNLCNVLHPIFKRSLHGSSCQEIWEGERGAKIRILGSQYGETGLKLTQTQHENGGGLLKHRDENGVVGLRFEEARDDRGGAIPKFGQQKVDQHGKRGKESKIKTPLVRRGAEEAVRFSMVRIHFLQYGEEIKKG